MTGDESDGMVGVAVGDRDAGIGQAADPGGDARHDAEVHARARQRLCFLAATAEHKRIAAFQPKDAFALPGQGHQQVGDFILLAAAHAGALAGIDFLGV